MPTGGLAWWRISAGIMVLPPRHSLQAGELRALHQRFHRHSSQHAYVYLSIRQDKVTVFAHALFGGAHIREDLVINNSTSDRISSTNFAFLVGGGVDIALSHRFAVRIQPDYLKTEILGRKQNNFRASAGVVFRFGQ
jgi:opacity protein-like surface antigen